MSELFRIDSGVRQGSIMSTWLFTVYMGAVMKGVEMVMGRRGVRFLEEWRECRLPGLLYADDLALCGESEDDLGAMVGRFVEVCRRRGLKVNAGKSKVMILKEEGGLEREVHVDRIRLEHVLEFNYSRCVLNESGTDGRECGRKVANEVRIAGTSRSLVNAYTYYYVWQ